METFVNMDRLFFLIFFWGMVATMLLGPWVWGFEGRNYGTVLADGTRRSNDRSGAGNPSGGAVLMPVMLPGAYQLQLMHLLDITHPDDPAASMTIKDLEEACAALNLDLPIVRLPDHFHYSKQHIAKNVWADLCKCGAYWPCPGPILDREIITDPGPTVDLRPESYRWLDDGGGSSLNREEQD